MSDLQGKVVEIILDVVRPERPDLSNHDESLLAGALDSLDFASVLMALEDEFGFMLADEDPEQLNTVNKLVTFIEAKRKG
jgi:acyl carrier protein